MLINDSFYYVHIPATGGRYIRKLLATNAAHINDVTFNEKFSDPLKKKIERPHLEYPYYLFFYQNDYEKMTVVRNPIDRFVSMFSKNKLPTDKQEDIFKSYGSLSSFINKQIITNSSNWYVPQVNFLSFDTKIWKYEDGLSSDFYTWINDNFSLNITNTDVKADIASFDFNKKIELNEREKQLLKDYYYKDFKLLNYS